MFTGKLEVAADEDKHGALEAGGLRINGGVGVVAVVEGKGGELGNNVEGTLDLPTLKRQHRPFVIQIPQTSTVPVERRVVVLHEGLCQSVWIHLLFSFLPPNSIPVSSFLQIYDTTQQTKHHPS